MMIIIFPWICFNYYHVHLESLPEWTGIFLGVIVLINIPAIILALLAFGTVEQITPFGGQVILAAIIFWLTWHAILRYLQNRIAENTLFSLGLRDSIPKSEIPISDPTTHSTGRATSARR